MKHEICSPSCCCRRRRIDYADAFAVEGTAKHSASGVLAVPVADFADFAGATHSTALCGSGLVYACVY